jgi:hypothetical protein
MRDEPREPPSRESGSEEVEQEEVDAVERGDVEPGDHAEEADRAAKREEEAAEG